MGYQNQLPVVPHKAPLLIGRNDGEFTERLSKKNA